MKRLGEGEWLQPMRRGGKERRSARLRGVETRVRIVINNNVMGKDGFTCLLEVQVRLLCLAPEFAHLPLFVQLRVALVVAVRETAGSAAIRNADNDVQAWA